ncbi:(d)CMP kinase [Candidatus Babeliales bacterium]|nr:(d)CMP kinase [Candidatus Babeliales bacterium]
MIITIDGPAGSGKSTVADAVAEKLGVHHMQTGLLYRAAAYILHGKNYRFDQIAEMLKKIEYRVNGGDRAVVAVDGVDITEKLSHAEFSQPASIISAIPEVREALLPVQKNVGENYDIVADGRDCGSVVFPDADIKIFLTALAEERAKRIMNDPKRKRQNLTFEEVLADVLERDERDKNRSVAPLIIPKDAIVVDNSTFLSPEETVQKILDVIGESV